MKSFYELALNFLRDIPFGYRVFIGCVIGFVGVILFSLLGPLAIVLITLLVWLSAWLTHGYFITYKKENAPFWADRFLWYSNPFPIMALAFAITPTSISIGAIVIASIAACLFAFRKLGKKKDAIAVVSQEEISE